MSKSASDQLTDAYVLHARPYRETSLLLDVFTKVEGRISLISKGVRRAKSTKSAILQPFFPLLVAWRGRSDLQTLTHVEQKMQSLPLSGTALFAGFYLNELLTRLLHKYDPHPELFDDYHQVLIDLQAGCSIEQCLRRFEMNLLANIGYGLTADVVVPDKYYLFNIENGFIISQQKTKNVFLGADLQAIAKGEFENEQTLKIAKQLMRVVFEKLLQGKPLNSRCLFV